MKKNTKIWISLAAIATPIVLPLVAASCGNKNTAEEMKEKTDPKTDGENRYKNVPKSLLESVKNNFGIMYSEKLINEKANVTSNSVLEKIKSKADNLNEISRILEPYAYVNFDNIDTTKFKYELDLKKTKATSGVLHLIFKVTPLTGNTNISLSSEFDLIDFQKDLSNAATHNIAGMIFSETVTSSGEEITGPMLVAGLKELTSKPVKEQLAYLKKYITISGDYDSNAYDLKLHPEYIHDHGLTNVHMKVSYKAKNESQWKEIIFFVYGFDAKNKSDVFGLKVNEKSKRITSIDLLAKLKNLNTWNEQLAVLQEYFNFTESDSFKYYDYEINKEKSIVPYQKIEDEDEQKDQDKKQPILDSKSLNLVVNKIDKFDKTKKVEINFEIKGLDIIKAIGYLEFEELGYGTEEFSGTYYRVGYSSLKNYLESEGFKRISAKEQIDNLIVKLNEGIDPEEGQPARIIENLVSKYDMKINPKFIVKRGNIYPDHIVTFTFEITDKTTNKTTKQKVQVPGFDFYKELRDKEVN
ncbi:hypothetical protein DA803_03125 [[Mycoplasma] phocae]|uniref:Uncharacterized protein n=1 Tax=[Mycoplasma] phocae TaxID=142651 RepID=A0A2Z5IRE8_9BACT|nr:variable surface lipoprotein [[Mycoplasma] phocae]AXE61061.1 hypothetical protein DA803_03125 [[Mycoplasma] phocae]